jgi:hypothetical protein
MNSFKRIDKDGEAIYNSLYEFFEQEEYFLGVFENNFYRITKKYLPSAGVQMRVYYTLMTPLN